MSAQLERQLADERHVRKNAEQVTVDALRKRDQAEQDRNEAWRERDEARAALRRLAGIRPLETATIEDLWLALGEVRSVALYALAKIEGATPPPTVGLKRPRTLTCCCCGTSTRGRQWWNRDTGYGICERCADSEEKSQSPAAVQSCYGHRGVHYALPKDGGAQ